MEIKNVTQFNNFISGNNLSNSHPNFSKLTLCLTDYSRMCNCGNQIDRDKKYNECNQLYIQAINSISPQLKYLMMSKITDSYISFNVDNRHIKSIYR
jgi:hypothetical protein